MRRGPHFEGAPRQMGQTGLKTTLQCARVNASQLVRVNWHGGRKQFTLEGQWRTPREQSGMASVLRGGYYYAQQIWIINIVMLEMHRQWNTVLPDWVKCVYWIYIWWMDDVLYFSSCSRGSSCLAKQSVFSLLAIGCRYFLPCNGMAFWPKRSYQGRCGITG